ncbi:MAG: ABC transporter ATP-binding protein [Elusimicrobia bacterium]|nr:ABC transporter ATP-binding protein [Elusimicrobiota bacterium]
METIVDVKNLCKSFPIERGIFQTHGAVDAVRKISFSISAGEIVALVGESGSGKSTIGRLIQGLIQSSSGEIFLDGKDASSLSSLQRAHLVQTIFQDPYSSLNPKRSVGSTLLEAVRQSQTRMDPDEEIAQVQNLLESTGLPKNIFQDYPHQFSGGQRQRIGIARALAMKPKLILADEPVSALDMSTQSQILNLLLQLNSQFGIAYLLISHDLSVVRQVADRVLVIRNGEMVEQGPVSEILSHPKESYTQNLIRAVEALEI